MQTMKTKNEPQECISNRNKTHKRTKKVFNMLEHIVLQAEMSDDFESGYLEIDWKLIKQARKLIDEIKG